MTQAPAGFVYTDVAREMFRSRRRETILTGPAGTGKSRIALEYLDRCCRDYAGARCLIVRKTRASLTESALVTFERDVLPPGDPMMRGALRPQRRAYRYPLTGSTIVVGGLNDPVRIMSTEWDLIFVQEARELLESDWEDLSTRLRMGPMPYRRLIGDTNPDRPGHWILRRRDAGLTELIATHHVDNPRLYDYHPESGQILEPPTLTAEGVEYMERLGALSGPRRRRMLGGEWCQAEGIVYDAWDQETHLVDRFDVPADWARIWVIDWGYRNPLVWQDWARSHDGELYLVHEIYQTGLIVEDLVRRIVELGLGQPEAIICDHDAGERATFERHMGLATRAAHKGVTVGIQSVQGYLAARRLYVMRDARDHAPDPILVRAAKPTCTAEEITGYVYPETTTTELKVLPLKINDHGCDCIRYLCSYMEIIDPTRVAEAPVIGEDGTNAAVRRELVRRRRQDKIREQMERRRKGRA